MLQAADHLLFLVLAVLAPIRARYGLLKLERASDDDLPRVRVRAYRQILILQWSFAAAVGLLWLATRRAWADLGLVPRIGGGVIGVGVGIVIVIALLALQQRRARQEPEAWDRLRRRMEKLERLLPHTPSELRWFEAVSLTAGVCEELLYRGFMIWYLSHWLPIWPAAVAAAALFGIGHLYQGLSGILRTGALGVFLAAIYLLTGSLYMSMVLHFMADFYSGRVMYDAYQRAGTVVEAPAVEGEPEGRTSGRGPETRV